MARTEHIFDSTLQKTNEILDEIEGELNWLDRKHHAYSLLRAVLHSLRDRLTVDEAADFGAQLPMLVRGFYYEGWRPSLLPIKMGKDDFLDRVKNQINFQDETDMEKLVKIVLKVLEKHISSGEIGDLRSVLPKKISDLF